MIQTVEDDPGFLLGPDSLGAFFDEWLAVDAGSVWVGAEAPED